MDDDLRAESDWLAESSMSLTDRDAAYNSKRLRSDYLRKSRGYKSRHQGGEVTTDGPSGGSESGSSDAA